MKVHRVAILPMLALLLTGGTTADMLKSQTAPSAAIKRALVNAARDYLLDPYSVRDAEISSVVTVDAKRGWQAVCVMANAKNAYGAYVGRQAVSVRLLKGKPMSTRQQAPLCYTRGLRYYRFRELEAL